MEATMMAELNDFMLIKAVLSLFLNQCNSLDRSTVVLSESLCVNGSPVAMPLRIYTGAAGAAVVSSRRDRVLYRTLLKGED